MSGMADAAYALALAPLGSKSAVVRDAVPGVDALTLIQAAVAKVKAMGGGTVFLPYIGGGGYRISDTIVVDFDDCTILLDDDVTLTKTDATALVGPNAPYETGVNGVAIAAFYFAGVLRGPGAKSYIKRPRLIGLRRVKIDGNARNVTNFTYALGAAGGHHAIVFSGTIDAECRNVYAYNGLVGGITQVYGGNALFVQCDASNIAYDNGIDTQYNLEHIATFSDDDPTTWNNARIIRCRAWACANHGIGIFGAVGVYIENPKVWNCGNNTGTAVSGPAGGIHAEHDGTNTARNYRFRAVDCEINNTYGFGFRTNCLGTYASGRIRKTKIPTAYTDSSSPIWGNALFVQGAADAELQFDVDGAERNGIRMAAAGSLYPSARFRGKIENCNDGAILALGIARLVTDPTSLFRANGNSGQTTSSTYFAITINNGSANTDAGVADIAGTFEDNYCAILTTSRLGTLTLTRGIRGHNNAAAATSATQQIYGTDLLQFLSIANISITNTNGKVARIAQFGTPSSATVDYASILGAQSNGSVPSVSFATTPGVMFGNRYNEASAPTGTPTYTGQIWSTASAIYQAKGRLSAADWIQIG